MQHRQEAYELLDRTKAGRRRLVILRLVDPHYRICSTRNVPPQQYDWWANAGLDRISWNKRGLPAEIVEMIRGYVRDGEQWPVTPEEAARFRGEAEKEQDERMDALQERVGYYHCGY
ncbi:hypothetical protein HIM_07884 [Hirsutella minnesotensis 3608]|uniref:DUF4246 domain-containing protein n=1 Tax=Hirsutella minnesotensis 3608 TaxID=1043627 RepID=A0A0F7ZYL7_9HYPO|nr:hypothetical protein HIM_07884 [Hirsutella minnesotensis 3608]